MCITKAKYKVDLDGRVYIWNIDFLLLSMVFMHFNILPVLFRTRAIIIIIIKWFSFKRGNVKKRLLCVFSCSSM